MTLALFLYFLLPLSLVSVLLILGVRSKLVLIGIPSAFIALPVLLVLGLFLFRAPIQQGKVLAGLGPLMSLVFPADDLYEPLVTVALRSGTAEHELSFAHKYVGRHAVKITVPGKFGIEKLENDLQVSLRIYDGASLLHEDGPKVGGQFWGKDSYGLHFTQYSVPQDAPVGTPLSAVVHINGDLKQFLEGRDKATLGIIKMSDE
jgi:hypothetical protein